MEPQPRFATGKLIIWGHRSRQHNELGICQGQPVGPEQRDHQSRRYGINGTELARAVWLP